jgi:hypothetical protein
VRLKGARGLDGVELEAARVQPRRQQVDGCALSGCVPTLKDDNARYLGVPAGFFQVVEPPLQARDLYLVLRFGKLSAEVNFLQHAASLLSLCYLTAV